MTSSPLSDWLIYAWMVLDMTTQGKIGLTGSETSACSGKLSSGSFSPTIFMMTLVCPAADPAFFQHGDVFEAVLFRQVVRRAEPVTATPDNHRIVGCFGFRFTPLL